MRDLQKRIILYGGVSEEAAVIDPGFNRAPNIKLEGSRRFLGFANEDSPSLWVHTSK